MDGFDKEKVISNRPQRRWNSSESGEGKFSDASSDKVSGDLGADSRKTFIKHTI